MNCELKEVETSRHMTEPSYTQQHSFLFIRYMRADPGHAGGILYPIFPGNASGFCKVSCSGQKGWRLEVMFFLTTGVFRLRTYSYVF